MLLELRSGGEETNINSLTDVLSNMDMFDLENDLPDELMSSGASWGLSDNIGNPKPPAQGPGPGGIQNGIENADANTTLRQQIQLSHMLQQQVSSLVGCDLRVVKSTTKSFQVLTESLTCILSNYSNLSVELLIFLIDAELLYE